MNRILLLFTCLLTSTLASAQDIKFYDVDGRELNRETFLKKTIDTRQYLGISFQDGRTTISKLIRREKIGKLTTDSTKLVYNVLEQSTGSQLNGKLLTLNYHPGPDPCNSTGTFDKGFLREKFNTYLKRVRSISAQFFIYSNSQGLERYEGIIDWLPDPGHLIQNTFFKHHYPCGSYVIINPNGDYYAYYGEYSLDHVIKNARKMAK